MITAVDTNILIDVFIGDKKFGLASATAIRRCMNEGAVTICGVVLVETMPLFPSSRDCVNALAALRIEPTILTMPSFLLAGAVWAEYRQHGGNKDRVVADFLIGAHAQNECDRLLTRDRGFYRRYFKGLNVIEPT